MAHLLLQQQANYRARGLEGQGGGVGEKDGVPAGTAPSVCRGGERVAALEAAVVQHRGGPVL